MKKLEIHQYHIADILTLCKTICTGILGVLCCTGATPEVALIIFGVGELCDAFDGICARRLAQYPNDGKYRWWREYAPEIDQITDIMHLSVMGIFYIFRICPRFTYFKPWIALSVTLVIAVVCAIIQVIATDPKNKGTARATHLILGRRLLYLACIATIVLSGLYAVTWPIPIKVAIVVALCLGAIILIIIKWDRLTQVKTPLE